jgi:single-strand DNA-binding protein
MAVANFTLAVDRVRTRDGKEPTADFPDIVAFGKTAEIIEKYAAKGSLVGITGRLQTRSYEKDGQKVFITEVVVDEAEFVESANNGEAKTEAKAEAKPSNDEMPFEI